MNDAARAKVRAKVEADPARAISAMFSKMNDEDKEAFNFLIKQARLIGENSVAEKTAALRAELDGWRTGAHADETGHLHRCAKVNGAWRCVVGCAKAEVAALRTALEKSLNHAEQYDTGCLYCGGGEIVEGTTTEQHRAGCWWYQSRALLAPETTP